VDRLTELAIAARDGNRYALDEFVRTSQPLVHQLCRWLGDPDSAEDLVQETYLRALRALPRFRSDGSARSWLLSIARNTCADATRRRVRWRRHTSAAPVVDVAQAPGHWAEVDDLLARLDTDRREAFVLTQLLGMSYVEAAELASVPVGTIRSRVARARTDLIGLVGDHRTGTD
jgi:RNA polymerase sigma-70 factor, ECF subfamily